MSSCEVFAPQASPCGAFGTCVESINSSIMTSAYCLCEDGYTTFGDFSIKITNPCDINLIAIKALWAVTLAATASSYVMSFWGILSRKQSGKLQWRAWRLWSVPYLVIIQSSFIVALAVGKFIDPVNWIVGRSLPMTVIHGLAALTAVTFLVIGLAGVSRTAYSDNVRGLSLTERLEMRLRVRRLETAIAVFWLISGACAFVPCAILNNPDNVFWSAGVHGSGFAVEMIILGVMVAPQQLALVRGKVAESLLNHPSKQPTSEDFKMRRVLVKLQVGRRLAGVGFTVTALSIALMSLWPYLVIKTAYALPVFYVVTQLAACALIWVTTTTNALQLKRPSLFSKRLSQAMTSATARRSADRKTSSAGPTTPYPGDRRTLDAALLPLAAPVSLDV